MLKSILLVLILDFGNAPSVEAFVRLMNGDNPCSGRVEFYYDGQWGTVCDGGWDQSDAAVVCRELGCGNVVKATTNAYFEEGTGRLVMYYVGCTGYEISLMNCQYYAVGLDYCAHSHDAGVICEASKKVDLRLANGRDSCSGRVEVFYNGSWGTVSDDGWDLSDAAVVCRELNCGNVIEAKSSAYFGQGTGPVWLGAVECNGTENSLVNCTSTQWGIESGNHSKDAGVICSNVKLVSGSSACEGQVQILHQNIWGSVCSYGWDTVDASVVCQQLNCGDTGQLLTSVLSNYDYYHVWMNNVACTGDELSLQNCPFPGWAAGYCGTGLTAGVLCQKTVKQVVVRIALNINNGLNVNDPEIKKKLLEKIRNVTQSKGVYSVNWKTQPNEQVFEQKKSTGLF